MGAKRRELGWLGACVALALVLRLHGLGWGLPEVYEEATPFRQAWEMWGWGAQKSFDLNPHFFKYPSLTIYLQFLGQGFLYLLLFLTDRVRSALDFRVLYELDKTPFYLAGRAITALLGTAIVLPVFALAKRAGGLGAAVPAGLVAALSAPLIAKSQVIEVDVPLALFVAIACLLAVGVVETPTRRNCLLAGVAVGLATSSKYPGLFVILPVLVALLLASRRKPEAEAPGAEAGGGPAVPPNPPGRGRAGARRAQASGARRGVRRPAPRIGLAHGVIMVAVGFGAAVLVTSPFVFFDARSFWHDLGAEREHMRLGHFGSDRGAAWIAYTRDWFGGVMGWPLGLAGLLGLGTFAAARREPWAIVLASFFVPFVAVLGSWSMKADRYLLPLVPLGIVCATVLAARLARRPPAAAHSPGTSGRRRGGRDGPRSAVIALASLAYALPLLVGYAKYEARLRTDSRTQAKAWIEAHLAPGTFIAMEQLGPALRGPLDILSLDRQVATALQRRGYQPRIYAIQSIPMFQVSPERSERFYDLRLYEPADFVLVTGSVRDRYLSDRSRFSRQAAFYDSLEARFVRVQVFPSAGNGPEIVIYRNPSHTQPFAARSPQGLPDLGVVPARTATGGEPYFYYNLGLNHEGFGFVNHAIAAYEEGMRYPASDREMYTVLARQVVRCLLRQKRTAEATAFLRSAEARAPTPNDAKLLRQNLERILSAPP